MYVNFGQALCSSYPQYPSCMVVHINCYRRCVSGFPQYPSCMVMHINCYRRRVSGYYTLNTRLVWFMHINCYRRCVSGYYTLNTRLVWLCILIVTGAVLLPGVCLWLGLHRQHPQGGAHQRHASSAGDGPRQLPARKRTFSGLKPKQHSP